MPAGAQVIGAAATPGPAAAALLCRPAKLQQRKLMPNLADSGLQQSQLLWLLQSMLQCRLISCLGEAGAD